MLRMQARPAVRVRQGPLLLPARVLLLVSGLSALALGTFNLFHELHVAQVDRNYTIVALGVGIVWLASIIIAFRGQLIGVFVAGAIAFVELGVVAQSHFASTPGAIDTYVGKEGLPVAAALIGLVLACALTVMAAMVSWSHPTGYSRRRETLPLLIVATLGALLVILETTDNVHLAGQSLPAFGTASPEDGAFAAAVSAALWLIGGLWIARVRRTGAVLIALGSSDVCYSFVILHIKGETTLSVIASKSGLGWAVIAAAVAILAAASLLVALGLLAISILRRKRAVASQQPARRQA